MTSNVTCDYASAVWENNSRNQTACQVYAELQGQCDSSFIIQQVLATSPAYTPPNNFCGCNIVAYNLMAGCAWCQAEIQTTWWLTISQWAGNCTEVQFNPNGIPASIVTDNIVIPQWALAIPTGTTWVPSQASLIAVPPSLTSTSTTTFPTSQSFVTLPLTTNSFTSSLGFSDPSAEIARKTGESVGIAFGVILGLWALSTVVIMIVYFARQNQRKSWYAPMAAFYQSQKGGYGCGVYGEPPINRSDLDISTRPPTPLAGQYPPHVNNAVVGSNVPFIYPNQYLGGSPSNATTHSNSAAGYHPPPTDTTSLQPPTAVGYNSASYVPPPPESEYHDTPGAHVQGLHGGAGAPNPYSGHAVPGAWGGNGAASTMSVYGAPGNTSSVYGAPGNPSSIYSSQTALASPGVRATSSQASPPGTKGTYRGHAEVY